MWLCATLANTANVVSSDSNSIQGNFRAVLYKYLSLWQSNVSSGAMTRVISRAQPLGESKEVWTAPLVYRGRLYVKIGATLACLDIAAKP